MKKIAIPLLMLICCLTFFCWGCGKEETVEPEPEPLPEEPKLTCPLDGEVIESGILPKRVFAVAIDNGPNSEPQSNLSQADLVFEVPVEGNINRFLALYYHHQPDVIGPVRSARHYFIELVQSFHGIYVHCGGSPQAYNALSQVQDIDEVAETATFWRDSDRTAPVNLYTSWERLNEKAEAKGWNEAQSTTEFSFYSQEELDAMTVGTATEISIPYQYKSVAYSWDNAQGIYQRLSNGDTHMDKESGVLVADNIITMSISRRVIDDEGRLDMSFVGNSGSGYLFQRGKAYEITWSMAGEGEPLRFTLSDGSEIKLVPGRTFIQVVPMSVTVSHNGTVETLNNANADAGEETYE